MAIENKEYKKVIWRGQKLIEQVGEEGGDWKRINEKII